MAPKKGQLKQIIFPMVDATDFNSVESAITESDFNSGATRKYWGYNDGSSAATASGTISKAGSLVRSGVFRLTLKTTENNYDNMMVRVSKTGCAEQILVWVNEEADNSDLTSILAAVQSLASDAHSAAAQANSRVLLILSNVSDVQSNLTVVRSLASDAHSAAAQGNSRVLLVLSNVSDVQSNLTVVRSLASDAHSAAAAASSRALVAQSLISDVYSQLSDFRSDLVSLVTVTGVQLNASTMSDIRSAIGDVSVTLSASDISDIASQVADGITGVTASDISDIASAVYAILVSNLSDILSAAQQTNSRVLVVQSMASDLASAVSDFRSDLTSLVTVTGVQLNASSLSDLRSAIAGATATLTASDISDIASAVRANLASDISDILSAAQQANSRVLVVQSMTSDAHSAATVAGSRVVVVQSLVSDVQSALAAGVGLNASALSDIGSRVESVLGSRVSDILSAAQQANSRVLVAQSLASDAHSAIGVANSRVLLNQSRISDVYSLLSDLHSDLGVVSGVVSDLTSALAAGVTIGASSLSDIRSAIAANGMQAAGAEPAAVVGHTGTLAAKLDWLTALSRNKITQTATQQALRNDADNDNIASAAVSDDGTTFVRAEFA